MLCTEPEEPVQQQSSSDPALMLPLKLGQGSNALFTSPNVKTTLCRVLRHQAGDDGI